MDQHQRIHKLHRLLAGRRTPLPFAAIVADRNNWYLDAWCHQSDGYRRFACERIEAPEPLDTPAREVSDAELDAQFAAAYGIFAGTPSHTAVLRFSPAAARWVADEQWHPDQQGRPLPDGGYELRLPYGHATELLMDILRHGPDCEVLGPPQLRQAVRDLLGRALAQYPDTNQPEEPLPLGQPVTK